MSTNTVITLSPQQITKDTFVVVEEAEMCFEIGFVRESQLQHDHKELKILILTAGASRTSTPNFNSICDPFLPHPMEEIALDAYPTYPMDMELLVELLEQQENYLQAHSQLPASQKALEAFLAMKKLVFDPHVSTHA